MKNLAYIALVFISIMASCTTSKSATPTASAPSAALNDTVRIANEDLKYEVIIVDPGFSTWLYSKAHPRGYHSQSYLEIKNRQYVSEWNNRVTQPSRYNPDLYEMTINYDENINYGYEVNYLIYNYMIYFQNTFKQKLNGYVPIR